MALQEWLAVVGSPRCSVSATVSSAVQVSGCVPVLRMVQPVVSCTILIPWMLRSQHTLAPSCLGISKGLHTLVLI